jgi:LPS export ABC transporter protein LptC
MKSFNFKIFKIAAWVTSCFFVLSCENDINEVKEFNNKKLGIDEATQIESYYSQAGKMRAKLTAPIMLRYQLDTSKVEFVKGLHVDFFDDSLKIESQLNAKFGRYFENDNKVFLRDSIVVFNRNKDTLFCDELYWDQAKSIFYTDKKVSIHKPDQIVNGVGLTADQSFKNFTIFKISNSYLNVADSLSTIF